MRKTAIPLMFFFVLISGAYALVDCLDEVTSGVDCQITTPKIACSDYDIYNDSNDLTVDDAVLTQIGSSGIYFFEFNLTPNGRYVFHLCSNDTGVLNVVNKAFQEETEDILGNVTSFALYKADVSSLATTAQLLQNTSAILSRGNSAWITATGFVTSAQLAQNTSAIIARGDSAWVTASGFSTAAMLAQNTTVILLQLDSIEIGISSNSSSAQAIWNYNLTGYNVTGDLDSAGGYLRALEVFGYG